MNFLLLMSAQRTIAQKKIKGKWIEEKKHNCKCNPICAPSIFILISYFLVSMYEILVKRKNHYVFETKWQFNGKKKRREVQAVCGFSFVYCVVCTYK